MSAPDLILITGIMASGKSTVAQALAERLPKSVHLRGDIFRRMIVSGRLEMTPNAQEAAYRQLQLRYELAAAAADLYCDAGFTVVYQDVILGPQLSDVVARLKHNRRVAVIVLAPSPEVVAQREAGRGKIGYGEWTPAMLDHGLRTDTPRIGLWLDTTALSVVESVDAILAQLDQGIV